MQRPGGRERPCPGTGRTCSPPRAAPVTGPATPHTSAPPWRVRALHEGEAAVGRGEDRRASKSVGGRSCTVGARPGAAEIGLQAGYSAGDRVVGRGHPGKRMTGRGVLGVERRTASRGWLPWSRYCIRSGAGLRPSRRRRAGPYGKELRKEPGDLARRAGTGEPRAGQDSGSPRAWTCPVATPDPGTCGGQPVARERSGRPLGLTPGTATAPRGTGGIHRGPVDAGPWGDSTAAEEGATGWVWGGWFWGGWV